MRELRPGVLALPEQYLAVGARAGVCADERAVLLRRGGVAALGVRRRSASATLSAALAATANPRELRPGLCAAPLSASLRIRDSDLTLEPAPPAAPGAAPSVPRPLLSAPGVEELVRALAGEGVSEARVEGGADGCIVHLPRHDTLLHLEPSATHVFCAPQPALRAAISRALAKCLPAL